MAPDTGLSPAARRTISAGLPARLARHGGA